MKLWNLIGWILRCLNSHWLQSPCLKTPSERFFTLAKSDWLIAMGPWNLIGWSPWVLEIWLADRHGPLKSDWLNFPMLKTLLVEFSVSKNLIGWVERAKKITDVFWPLTLTQTPPQTTYFYSYDPPYSRGNITISMSIRNRYLWISNISVVWLVFSWIMEQHSWPPSLKDLLYNA